MRPGGGGGSGVVVVNCGGRGGVMIADAAATAGAETAWSAVIAMVAINRGDEVDEDK